MGLGRNGAGRWLLAGGAAVVLLLASLIVRNVRRDQVIEVAVRISMPVPATYLHGDAIPTEAEIMPADGVRAEGHVRFRCCGCFFVCAENGRWPERLVIPAGTIVTGCDRTETGDGTERCIAYAGRGRYRTTRDAVIVTSERESGFWDDYAQSKRVPVVRLSDGWAFGSTAETIRSGVGPIDDVGIGAVGEARMAITHGDVVATRKAVIARLEPDARRQVRLQAEARGLRLATLTFEPSSERNPFVSDLRDPFDDDPPETLLVELRAVGVAYEPEDVSRPLSSVFEGLVDSEIVRDRTEHPSMAGSTLRVDIEVRAEVRRWQAQAIESRLRNLSGSGALGSDPTFEVTEA